MGATGQRRRLGVELGEVFDQADLAALLVEERDVAEGVGERPRVDDPDAPEAAIVLVRQPERAAGSDAQGDGGRVGAMDDLGGIG